MLDAPKTTPCGPSPPIGAPSAADRVPHGAGDSHGRRLVEVGVHGQAKNLATQPLADRQRARPLAPAAVGRLQVHRHRIVDRGRDPLPCQRRLNLVAPIQPDRVLRPGGATLGQPTRQTDGPGKHRVVERRHPLTGVDLGIEGGQFDQQNRGLEGIETAVEADPNDVVLAVALAVLADRAPARGLRPHRR